jgi:predicted transcriptional regulator of viral defense system
MDRARKAFEAAGGLLRTSSALSAGIHPRTLYAMRDSGVIERVSRGMYRLADAPPFSNPDIVVVCSRVPGAVLCLVSALAFHNLTTQVPHRVDIAIAPGARTPKLEYPPTAVYRFSRPSLSAGIEGHMIDGVPIRVFAPAKTVADCFKFRRRVGIDVAIEGLKSYLLRRGSNVEELIRYADINRMRTTMMPYIEATL